MKFPGVQIVGLLSTLQIGSVAQSWKRYPLVLETDPSIVFPQIEGAQYQDMGDAWFLTAEVQGQTTGKRYQIVNIFDRNYITAVILNFYQASIFDYDTGSYVTYTDYDLPGVTLLDMKFRGSGDHLDLGFNSSAGNATWTTVSPFKYALHCPGIDDTSGSEFAFDVTADFMKKPVPYGASTLRGRFEFFSQKNTLSYYIVRPRVEGTLTMHGVTEVVSGFVGHMDRQIFPLYSGIFTPTGRQHSHEWREINFSDGTDLAIWRQFDRINANKVIPTSGVTSSPVGSESIPRWTNALPLDLTVEYINYAKYPRQSYSTLVPPPSQNMYLPGDHIIRSKALGMELSCRYINKTPAITLPIEYFEGPAIWNGTYQGRAVQGVGIFESTLGLYRDWELAKVLYDSVTHLPKAAFSQTMSRGQVAQVVQGVNTYVSSDKLKDDRVGAAAYIDNKILPALKTMNPGNNKSHVLEIADDLKSSLSLAS